MKVVPLRRTEKPVNQIPLAGCFRLGVSVYMVIRNHAVNLEPSYNQVINLASGETSKIDRRTMVEPIKIEAVEVE